jgi:ABC-2 type transport system ATP-binding protein
LYPTSGLVEVLRFTPSEKEYAFLKQIAFVMGHKNQLLWELPAMDSFKLNKEIYEIDDRTFKNTVNELIELLQAEKLINQPVKTLSLGQRMRMELIASLLHKPKILFLDEPTIGLDIFAQTTIINFIKEYQKRYNSTIMLTSHYMQDVQRLAKRLIMINHGRIIFDGLLQDLVAKYSQQKMVHITLLKPLPKDFETPEEIKCEYNFPQLRINTQKEHIAGILSYMLKKVEFTDVTIEDEPIEEIIKKIFTSSQNTVSPPK